MNTTGIFTTHYREIVFENYNEPYYLLPIGDIHRFCHLCDEERYLEYLDWVKTKERKLILGMGDYDDIGSSSERLILGDKRLHDSTKRKLDEYYIERTDLFTKEWSPFKDDIVGMIEGNHYSELQSGITTTQYMCTELGCKYLGVSSVIRLSFRHKKRDNKSCVDIWAHHGKGAAKKTGGSLNRVEDMVTGANVDIYLMGHDHKKSAGFINQLELSQGNGVVKLKHKKKLLARTGSFLNGYQPDEISYVADACYNPTNLGAVKIELTPKRDKKNGNDSQTVDIHVSL